MDFHKTFDCAVGGCAMAAVALSDSSLGHFAAVGGAVLVAWRLVQAFVLEPLGIFWPRPRNRRG